MILYSIIPSEIVFQNMDSKINDFKEIHYLGERVIVSPAENNQYKIDRLISTSPQAFLNPKLQPGSLVQGSI